MRQVYLDNFSAISLHPEVVELTTSLLKEGLVDPSSLHGPSRRAKEVLEVIATDERIKAWCQTTGNEFLGIEEASGEYRAYVKKSS
ncbi:MAG: sulfurtransferase TusA family protein [Candidatus Brocadiales bacterium]